MTVFVVFWAVRSVSIPNMQSILLKLKHFCTLISVKCELADHSHSDRILSIQR